MSRRAAALAPSTARSGPTRPQEAAPGDWVHRQIESAAQELYDTDPDWIGFFREVFGPEGVVRQSFTTPAELDAFSRTEIYAKLQRMMADLRSRSDDDRRREPIRVITIRIPDSLHRLLKREAKDFGTSMNQLCISKLLQDVAGEYIPADPASVPAGGDA